MIKKKAMTILVLFVAAAFFLVVSPGASSGQESEELETDQALTFEVQTPHIDWAHPYARGKIHALFFINGRGTNFREAVELMQRFDIEAEAALYARIIDSQKDDWHGGNDGIKRIERLLEKDWDVFIFLGVAPLKLPESLRQKVIKKVQEGCGVILSGADDPALSSVAAGNGSAPVLASVTDVKIFYAGKGRVVQLPSRPVIEYSEGWQNTYESWQEELGRAAVWAASREPRAALSFALSKQTFTNGETPKADIKWSGKSAEEKLRLQLWIRKPAGWLAPWQDHELARDEIFDLTLPRLPAGRYHLDGRIIGPNGVEDWETVPFEVIPQRKINEIKLTPAWGEIGGKITGSVLLSGTAGPGETVRIETLDKDRRALLRTDVTSKDDRLDFSFDIPSWLPMLVTIRATLFSNNEILMDASQYFHVTKRNRNQFNFLIWDVPRGTLAPYAEEVLEQTGVTLQLAQGDPPLYAAANDIAWVPYTTDISAKLDAGGIMTPFSWNDNSAVTKKTHEIAGKHLLSRQHGVFAYSLGDEISTKGADLTKNCLDAYQSYLKESYGTLEALNRSWGSDFKAWADITISKEGDNDETQSFTKKNYPRWFDRQAFKSYNFVNYSLKYAEAFKETDPEAKTGFEGAGRFENGDDIDLIVRSLDFWTPYTGTTDEVIRSIAPRTFQRSNWMGYKKDAESLLGQYWRMVTLGMDSVWWWRWECIGRFHGWLAPDLRPYPAVKQIIEDTKVVREGLGDLLLQSQMQDDGIAILYSYPSTFAHKLDEGAGFGDYEKAHVAWQKAIHDLGLQFSYVTDRMLRQGEFDYKHFSVLILPRAEAIGDQEAKVIQGFVEKGGVVIADTRPGIYDDHCKKRKAGALDELFGVRRVGYYPAISLTNKNISCILDPGLVTGNSRTLSEIDGVPELIIRKSGKGYTLLLNGDLNILKTATPETLSRFTLKTKNTNDTSLEPLESAFLAEALRSLAGINPYVVIRKDDGSAAQEVEITRWVNGENNIVSLFEQGGENKTVTVSLPKSAYVYDLRHEKSLGLVKEFKTEVMPNRASFFVVMTREAPTIKVQISQKGQRGKVIKAFLSIPDVKSAQPVAVTVRFSLTSTGEQPGSGEFFPQQGYPWVAGGRDNKKLELSKSVVVIGDEPAAVEIPIAFNDPTGDYEFSVTELFSHETITKELTIQ
jgi:hypothetical protein